MNEISNDPVEGIDAAPLDGDLYHWQAMIDGPEGTPYDGGIFTIDIVFPPEYPFKAPKVKFETRIYHPNVKTDSGEICADLIQNGWAPTLNLRHVLCTIQQVMKEPNSDSPLEASIAAELSDDPETFKTKAKAMTEEFASA